LQRHSNDEDALIEVYVERKRANPEDITGSQGIVVFQPGAVEPYGVAGPEITNVVITVSVVDARLQTRN
jgi:hypothetical protein